MPRRVSMTANIWEQRTERRWRYGLRACLWWDAVCGRRRKTLRKMWRTRSRSTEAGRWKKARFD